MRNILFILLTVSFLACEKDPIKIVYGPPSNTSDQKVLMEEFTGFNCTFCPQGSDDITSLISLNQGNVIAVSIHSGFFAMPNPQKNKYDFRTVDGDALYTLLGAGGFYPAAAINRTGFSTTPEGGLVNNQTSWAGDINTLRENPAAAGLSIETSYISVTRELKIKLTGIAKADFNEKLLANIMITESGIVDWQKDARVETPVKGENASYIHNHVFRDAVTQIAGDDFLTNPSKGQTFTKEYTYTLSGAWVAENCEVIGFITSSSSGKVIQVNEAKVVH
ncbi:MAG TPA: Omp28-related outer membrane protein [Saprospiraceae bacterium]|nr:Omp28-related outer membrane protein [Saprospiraceae bacterium]